MTQPVTLTSEQTSNGFPDDVPKSESVLFVDDEAHILSSIRRLIRPLGYQTYFAGGGAEGLEILKQHHIDLVISDMRMPQMDGAQFLTEVKKQWPDTVRMLLTGYADISSTIKALNDGGIYRYISKPWDDEELKQIVNDGLKLRRLEREKRELLALTNKQNEELQDLNKNLEAKVEARTEEIRQTSDMLDLAYQQLKESYDAFVRVFSSFISSRKTIRGRSQQVADVALKMAKALKLDEARSRDIYHAALLHELGKLSLSDELLAKSEDRLTELEAPQYRKYPLMGEMALTAITELDKTALIIRTHGELLDGSGFPEGLQGSQIPVGARIIRVLRDFVGLQSGMIRCERLTFDDAMTEIKKGAGKKYDPVVVKMLEHFKRDLLPNSTEELPYEIKIQVHGLMPGMKLTRDLVNSQGILLMAKGYVFTSAVINRLSSMKELDIGTFFFYVAK